MRIAVLMAASALVTACSSGVVSDDAQRSEPSSSTSPIPTRSTAPPTTTSPVPTRPPAAGAPIAQVIAWIEAGKATDADDYHRATRDGEVTQLGDDVAFTTPAGTTSCMTDSQRGDGTVACLVELTDPPPRPDDVYGEWKGGWVDFDGTSMEVGSAHADPGPFSAGTGPELPNGQTLSFGDYRCRADPAGLVCVNYAHRSAARFSEAGVEAFGCLREVPPPSGVGEKFSC